MNTKAHGIRYRLYKTIFGTDTKAGKLFDIFLIILISISVIIVMLESVKPIEQKISNFLNTMEWIITITFTIEYLVRVWVVRKPFKFIISFFGIIDFLACLPTYLSLLAWSGSGGFMIIRSLRLLRVFRVLKLSRYVNESSLLWKALISSRYKIGIFLYSVLMIVIVIGALMYLVEGGESGFDSIPRSMYWVIVTITTVGFGDITPTTTLGQFIAGFIMILGYAIIAIPTGMVTVEYGKLASNNKNSFTNCCPSCLKESNDIDANYCKYCGTKLDAN